MADIISCPSGLTGRIRGMKVREERVIADRKLAKSSLKQVRRRRARGLRQRPGRSG